ncbi:T9SS type A sorting domain-containing protein [Chryseobacterium sp. L7]|uniref:T9SS type A sorting domain-containing protein n=1 Tax=Chryseobacterium endalhagicum TaxID=2797638 RepID=A0ABS1QJE0_9FLAO|nr:T9SS type A sorting domain-containing protein [Chryseobacterium endalhagicum]MBL1222705.1 T9SS type A sorting domain-containing protein [Chryseobacterium endalhagicum]
MKKILIAFILAGQFSYAQSIDPYFGSGGTLTLGESSEMGSMIFNSDGNLIISGNLYGKLSIHKATYNGQYINDNFAQTNTTIWRGIVVLPYGNFQGQTFYESTYTKLIQLSNNKYSILGNYRSESPSSSVKSFYSLLLNNNGVAEKYNSIKMDYPNYATSNSPSFYDKVTDFVELSDGKVLLCGIADYNYPKTKTALTRFNQDGTVDTTFGNNGRLYITINENNSNESSGAKNVFLQNDKLIIVGTGNINDPSGTPINNDIYMIRLNLDGTYDTTFGNNGRLIFNLDIPNPSQYSKAVWDNNGNFYITGYSNLSSVPASPSYQTWIAKVSQDGIMNSSFGTNGIVKHNSYMLTGKSGRLLTVAANNTGVYIAQEYPDMSHGSNVSGPDAYISKFNVNGTIDNTFGNNGLFYSIGSTPKTDMIFDNQNRLMISGKVYGPNHINGAVRRLSPTTLSTSETTPSEVFSYYPNPVKDVLHIVMKRESEIKEIQLLSYSGQFIKNITFNKNSKTISADVKDVASGSYLLKIKTNDNYQTLKIIKE